MIYFIKRKLTQFKNLFLWVPFIWKQYDFDYRYATDAFRFKLLRIAKFLESDKAMSMEAKNNASRIRMVVRLMDKVYDDDYGTEYQTKLKEIYGDDILDWEFVDTGRGDGTSYMKYKYEVTKSPTEIKDINKLHDKLFQESQEKQKRAHKLLWDLIEHNIQNWWD